ncbi:MAG: hypothetical protein M0Z94_07100 [Dehalococcoidales bacterium]|nr:hypothetical protein [Dehalococcoidales bacterium]
MEARDETVGVERPEGSGAAARLVAGVTRSTRCREVSGYLRHAAVYDPAEVSSASALAK